MMRAVLTAGSSWASWCTGSCDGARGAHRELDLGEFVHRWRCCKRGDGATLERTVRARMRRTHHGESLARRSRSALAAGVPGGRGRRGGRVGSGSRRRAACLDTRGVHRALGRGELVHREWCTRRDAAKGTGVGGRSRPGSPTSPCRARLGCRRGLGVFEINACTATDKQLIGRVPRKATAGGQVIFDD